MDHLELISMALDEVKDALKREISLRGKPDHGLAMKDWRDAVTKFEDAVRAIDEDRDANRT